MSNIPNKYIKNEINTATNGRTKTMSRLTGLTNVCKDEMIWK